MTNDEKKSPLQRPPFRQAGQSLQEEIDAVLDDKVWMYLVVGSMLAFVVLMEWAQVLFKLPRQPWLFTVMFAGYVVYAYLKLHPLYARLRGLRLGRDGERTVGQELEKLRAHGFFVYHDFPADGPNIDHVVIGPTGVFTIETKAFRKPRDPEAIIGYDGRVLTVPGTKLDRDPVAQARAQRDFMRKLIKGSANRVAPVRPAVVFVGWYTQKQPEGAEVWVLNITGVLAFIRNELSTLSEDDIAHISSVLEQYILNRQRDLYDKKSPSWMT